MLQRVSPSLTTYQPGNSTAVPAPSQLRDRLATRPGSARAPRPAAGVLLSAALFGAPASFLRSADFRALPISPLERSGDDPCAIWLCRSTSLVAIFAASSADRRSAASFALW